MDRATGLPVSVLLGVVAKALLALLGSCLYPGKRQDVALMIRVLHRDAFSAEPENITIASLT